ncbi:MAG TPA: SelB C-terminal domain-containing protein, partial [Oligoflexia bacterium]|nr:SelB C-terminal domain-containing protein [Oligoflexia bacterium]
LKMISKLLTDEGAVRVLGGNYLLASIVEECRTKLLELFEEHQVVGLAAFREKTGLSRNIAVVVLEHFDSEGMTKRHGEGRMLLRKN